MLKHPLFYIHKGEIVMWSYLKNLWKILRGEVWLFDSKFNNNNFSRASEDIYSEIVTMKEEAEISRDSVLEEMRKYDTRS